MKKISIWLLILFSIIGLSCKQRGMSSSNMSESSRERLSANRIRTSPGTRRAGFYRRARSRRPLEDSSRTRTSTSQTSNQRVIVNRQKKSKNATLRIEVEKFTDSYNKISRMVASTTGAEIISSNTNVERNGYQHGWIRIAVPTNYFNDLFENLKAIGKVENERILTKDYTRLYYDLEARLRNEKRTKKRIEQIMYKNARTYNDVLDAYSRINEIQLRIDKIRGQQSYINSITSESKITIYFYEERSKRKGKFSTTFGKIWKGIKNGFRNLLLVIGFIIEYAITLSILFVLFFIGLFYVKKYIKRKKETK